MPLKATASTTEQAVLEPGSYPAQVVNVIDLGVQPGNAKYEKPPHHQVMITYELSDEFLKDEDGNDIPDKPRWMSHMFNSFSRGADKSTAAKVLTALDPKNETNDDFSLLIGKPCMVTAVHSPKADGNGVWVNIGGVSPMREKDAAKMPPLVNPSTVFDQDTATKEMFEALPPFVQNKIKEGVEFPGSRMAAIIGGEHVDNRAEEYAKGNGLVESEDDDEIPY